MGEQNYDLRESHNGGSKLLLSGSITIGTGDTSIDLTASGLPATGGKRVVMEFATNTAVKLDFGFGAEPAAVASATAIGTSGIALRPTTGFTREFIFDRGVTHIRGLAGAASTIHINVFDK